MRYVKSCMAIVVCMSGEGSLFCNEGIWRFQRVELMVGLSSPPYFNYDCPQSCVRSCAKNSMCGSIKAMGLIGDLNKRLCMVIHSLSPFTMAFHASKSKNPTKVTLVNAASAFAATSPSAINEFAGEYFDLYNNLLANKNKLLAADPGGEQKQALAEFGAGLVHLPHFELCCFFILFYF